MAKGVATVSETRTIMVMIANFSRKPRHLSKGWCLGNFQAEDPSLLLAQPVDQQQVSPQTPCQNKDELWEESLKELHLGDTMLNKKQQVQLKQLLTEHQDLFAENPKAPGTTTIVE